MVSQFIKVKNPPGVEFVAWATMPLPVGTDVTRVTNSLGAEQQYRRIGRTKNWEIYEWHVLCPAGTTQVDIIDTENPIPRIRRGPSGGVGGTIPPISGPQPLERYFTPVLAFLGDPNGVSLIFERHDGVTETVPITGTLGKLVRSGPLRITFKKHIRTQNFGAMHIYWDAIAFDPHVRLTINLHTGIPATEVLVKSIRVGWDANVVRWSPELNDPACDAGQGYLLREAATNHLFPRMGARAFRLLFYTPTTPAPQGLNTQPPGWGVGDWSLGGLFAADLKLNPLTYITLLESLVTGDAAYQNDQLGSMNNTWDFTSGDYPDPEDVLWPAWGQMYGGPTGSDSHYRPYAGIRTLASNRREGLLAHKVLQLRNHSRAWSHIYEPDGDVVIPERHLDSNGNAQWDMYIGTGSVFGIQGSFLDQYGQWRDEGFGFDAFNTKQLPRDYELQTNVEGGVEIQRWSDWDMQHRLLGFQDDLALAWLCADLLAIDYLTLSAEISRMVYWTGPGAAQRLTLPSVANQGTVMGRDTMWAMFAIANAAVFNFKKADLSEDVYDPSLDPNPNSRRRRWAFNQLQIFVQATEKAMCPSGVAWMGGTTGKVFTDPPFSSNYRVNQIFEVNYGMNAVAACYGAFGDLWLSAVTTLNIPLQDFLRSWARCVDQMIWGTTQVPSAVAIVTAGSGYAANDIVNVMGDYDYVAASSGIPRAFSEARIRIDTVAAGVPTAISFFQPGQYYQQPYDESPGAKTYTIIDTPAVVAAGADYVNNEICQVVGGTPINNSSQMQVRITANASGQVTGISSLVRTGRYLVAPTSPVAIVPIDVNHPGAGATISFARSAQGNGLRVNLTWGNAPIEAGTGPWKIFPLGSVDLGQPRYTTRADFSPIDICNRSAMKAPFFGTAFGQQAIERISSMNVLGLMQKHGAPEATPLLLQILGVSTLASAITFMRGWGVGSGSQPGGPIENFYALLAVFDTA